MLLAILIGILAHGGPSKPVVHGPRRTTSAAPVYRFASHERGTTISFRCAFDRPKLHPCKGHYRQRLSVGRHVLRVRALDGYGRLSPLTRVVVQRVKGAQLREIDVGGRPFSLVEAAGSLWIANFLSGTVERLDPG